MVLQPYAFDIQITWLKYFLDTNLSHRLNPPLLVNIQLLTPKP